MKEADLRFGDWYAIGTDDGTERWRLDYKHPVQPGKTRSRMYRLSDGVRQRDIDASKIRMLWVDYERTPEYLEKQADAIEKDLAKRVHDAQTSWVQLLMEYLTAVVAPYAAPGRAALQMPTGVMSTKFRNKTADEFVEEWTSQNYVTIPIAAFLKLADIPAPPATGIESAIEQQNEVLRHVTEQRLPYIAARLMAEIDLIDHGLSSWRFVADEYIAAVRLTETPGPHDPLIRLAKLGEYPADPTSDPLFAYLLNPDDPDTSDEEE